MIRMKITFFFNSLPIIIVKKGLFASFLVLMKETVKMSPGTKAGNLYILNHLLWCVKKQGGGKYTENDNLYRIISKKLAILFKSLLSCP